MYSGLIEIRQLDRDSMKLIKIIHVTCVTADRRRIIPACLTLPETELEQARKFIHATNQCDRVLLTYEETE